MNTYRNLETAVIRAKEFRETEIKKLCYRPFDNRFIFYNDNFVDRTRRIVGKEIRNDNLVLNFPKIVKVNWNHSLITKSIPTAISMDINGTYFAPLYLYPETTAQQTLDGNTERTPNLNPAIVKQIAEGLGLTFTNEPFDYAQDETASNVCFANSNEVRPEFKQSFAPIDLLDYIYAVLHSPTYRSTYKEFLKIDFPRVPYPKNAETFWSLVALGGELRQIHFLESPIVEKYITQYPEDGDNIVTKPKYEQRNYVVENDTITHNDTPEPMGRVHINEKQYFDNVPEVAWNFYIGGYQPAQKWLKDRKDRELSYEDILHYQKIIVALTETSRIMEKIDEVGV